MFSSSFAAWLKVRSNRSCKMTGKANSGWAPSTPLVFTSRILQDNVETLDSKRMFVKFLNCSSILGGLSSTVRLASCQRPSASTLLFLTNLSVLQPSPRSSLMHLPSLAWNWNWTSFAVPRCLDSSSLQPQILLHKSTQLFIKMVPDLRWSRVHFHHSIQRVVLSTQHVPSHACFRRAVLINLLHPFRSVHTVFVLVVCLCPFLSALFFLLPLLLVLVDFFFVPIL